MSERDICTKFITPALRKVGWDEMLQIGEEVSFTKGRIIVRGKLVSRGQAKRADYALYFKPNIPVPLIEAKDNSQGVGDEMQQGLAYAPTLDIPFVFSLTGDGFVFHGRTGGSVRLIRTTPSTPSRRPTTCGREVARMDALLLQLTKIVSGSDADGFRFSNYGGPNPPESNRGKESDDINGGP